MTDKNKRGPGRPRLGRGVRLGFRVSREVAERWAAMRREGESGTDRFERLVESAAGCERCGGGA